MAGHYTRESRNILLLVLTTLSRAMPSIKATPNLERVPTGITCPARHLETPWSITFISDQIGTTLILAASARDRTIGDYPHVFHGAPDDNVSPSLRRGCPEGTFYEFPLKQMLWKGATNAGNQRVVYTKSYVNGLTITYCGTMSHAARPAEEDNGAQFGMCADTYIPAGGE